MPSPAANPKLYARAVGQLLRRPLVLAPPFPLARHSVPPPGARARHRPGRSSGRQSRNKAAPAREDALGQTLPFHSLSDGPESAYAQRRIRGFFCPIQVNFRVYVRFHTFTENRRHRRQLGAVRIRSNHLHAGYFANSRHSWMGTLSMGLPYRGGWAGGHLAVPWNTGA